MTLPLVVLAFLQAASTPPELDAQAMEKVQQGRIEEARALWTRAMETAPGFYPALFNLGYSYVVEQRFADAAPFLRRAAKAQPDAFPANYLLGTVELQLGNRDAALRAWRSAIRLQPQNIKLLTVMAIEYGKGGYFVDAATAAKRAVAIQPDDLNTLLVAIKACHEAQDAAALTLARTAASKHPESARANFEYGFQLHRAGRAAEAGPYLRKAMQQDPSYEEPFFFYGGILLEEGKLEEAIANLKIAIANRPDYVAASVAMARALSELNRDDEAISILNAAIAKTPDHPQPHLMLSRILFRKGDEAGAAREKEVSLKLRTEKPALLEQPQGRRFP